MVQSSLFAFTTLNVESHWLTGGRGIDYSGRSRDSRSPIMVPWCSGSNAYLSVLNQHRPHISALFAVSDVPDRICSPFTDVIVVMLLIHGFPYAKKI